MNAKTYYDKNAILHGQEGKVSKTANTGKLTACPSEMDISFAWIIKNKMQGSILDIGCGPLGFLRDCEHLFNKRVGIDIASYSGWSKYPEIQTSVHNLDEGPLPFPDNVFDAVVMLMVLEHVFNPFTAVREIRRVMKPEGYAIIAVPNIASVKHRFGLFVGKLPITSTLPSFSEEGWDGYHLHNFTKASLNWLLRREGLEPMEWAAQGKWQSLKRLSPSFFGHDIIALCRSVEPNHNLPFVR